ncbi:SDR family oxidoreductase [Spartinivicinus ruber]|uniref:SDR family oxidoreductase n=1 Tax=Spartinivicinus ruber TaxID=2683272 RepID=UPI0013D0056C|nr:SDR family oxidoreductase [Spartinivicinus ruber]
MNQAFNFNSKRVFVMGGTSGINLGIAKCFASHGAQVAVASRSQEKVDKAVSELQTLGAEAIGFSVDVRDADKVKETFKLAHAQWGEFDVLVSGAAGNFPSPALGMSANGFKSVVDIDLLGSFNVLQAAHPYLTKPGASIINISAPQAFVASPLQSHVCAAKAGVDMLTRVLALEWGVDGIRINSIVPGPIENTEGMKRLAPTPAIQQVVQKTVPLNRLGTTDDIGHMAMFLASDYGSYVSGTVIPVDGGWSLGGTTTAMNELLKMLKGKS